MLLQNTLDLSTFEIVRFRIWNQTSNPDDKGVGTKYFNTNSGHEGYNRENIYTATGWRKTAYMDDIEALTNGEGSLGTRVKALEDMLGLQDVTDVIDTWNDVKAFFANVDEGLDLMTMLDGKLDKKGGTISNNQWANQLILNHSTSGEPAGLRFHSNNEMMGVIYVNYQHRLLFHNGTTPNLEVLHSGNVGEYTAGAAKKLETPVSLWGNTFDGTQDLGNGIHINNNTDYYAYTTDKRDVSLAGVSSGDVVNLAVGAYYHQLPTRIYGKDLSFRVGSNYTAMTITEEGNVNVAGPLLVASYSNALGANIRSTGLVHIEGGSSSVALGIPPVNGFTIGYDTKYALVQWLHGGNGSGNIQAMNVSGTATSYALNLNPLGGAVNVGEGGLNVAGIVAATGNITIKNSGGMTIDFIYGTTTDNYYDYRIGTFTDVDSISGFGFGIGQADGTWKKFINFKAGGTYNIASINLYSDVKTNKSIFLGSGSNSIYITSKSISWHDSNDAYVQNLVAFAQDNVTINPNLTLSKLLTVNGLATFNAGALIPSGQTLTIGSVTFKETATGEIEVDGNLHTTGTLASGGKGEAGENTTGNAMVYQYDLASGESVYTVDNVKGSTNVIVQIFEWNSNTSSWDMILTDVSVKADAITVTFGRTTTVNHMVTVC